MGDVSGSEWSSIIVNQLCNVTLGPSALGQHYITSGQPKYYISDKFRRFEATIRQKRLVSKIKVEFRTFDPL